MNDSIAQSSPTIVNDLLAFTESLNQSLPEVEVKLTQAGISLTPEQFDSLIASW